MSSNDPRHYDVLVAPVVTEKATTASEHNQVIFKVARTATKPQIKDAVEKLFDVKVTGVHTMVFRGKDKRVGKSMGRRKNWKKAVVTLKEGTDLDVFGTMPGEAPTEG